MNVIRLACLAMVVVSLSCAPTVTSPEVAGTALNRWEAALHFTATAETIDVPVGATLSVRATLANTGAEPIEACLRAPTQYTLWGTANLTQRLSIVDHRSCERRLSLGPAQSTSWLVPVEIVGTVGLGPARVFVLTDLIYARGCHRLYGCYHTSLRSQPLHIVIRPASPSGV